MLLDTSGLLSLFHRDEPEHKDALTFYTTAVGRLIHNYVLAEFVPLAETRGLARLLTLEFSESLLADKTVEVVWVDDQLHRQALALLKARHKRCADHRQTLRAGRLCPSTEN